jgi:hypothetical protein
VVGAACVRIFHVHRYQVLNDSSLPCGAPPNDSLSPLATDLAGTKRANEALDEPASANL